MDPIENPFSPGAGSPPPELAGRDEIITQAEVLLKRTLAGRSEKSLMLTGLRGVGKTVLLNKIEQNARDLGYRTILVEAHEEKSLAALLAPHLRTLLFELDRLAGAGNKVRKGLSILKSFVSAIQISVGEID
jgi:adenylylsulfate kinase-like enzyme